MKRILVIGSPVIDEIHTFSGKVYKKWGGISYTIAAAATLLPDYQIVPATWVGEEEREAFLKFISQYPNVSDELLLFDMGLTNRNRLVYRDEEERDEFFELKTRPVPLEHLRPHLDTFEAIMVNFITPRDIEMETLKSISMSFKKLMFGDIHSLLRRPSKDGKFELVRSLPNWNIWASCFDIIQLNHLELPSFTGFDIRDEAEYRMAAAMVLMAGPRCLNVTRGKNGSLLAYRENGEVFFRVYTNPPHTPVDPTGCGDIFGAAFVSVMLGGGDCRSAAEFANRKAMEKAVGELEIGSLELE